MELSDAGPVPVVNQKARAVRTGWSLLLSAAAALLVWGIVGAKHPLLAVSEKFSFGMGAPNEVRLAFAAERARIDRLNAAFVFGIGGSLLATALAVTASTCCATFLRAAIGLIWGAIWGAGTGFLSVIAAAALKPKGTLPELTDAGMVQAILFALLGTGIGLMVGGFSRSMQRTVTTTISTAIAGGVAGLLLAFVAGLLSPLQSTQELMPPEPFMRWLWLTLPFASIGTVAAYRSVEAGIPQPTCQTPASAGPSALA